MNTMPAISIVMPVLNEGGTINRVIARLRGLALNGRAEIIVVDGDPQGGTVGVIEDRSIRTVTAEQGRGRQMNRGAAVAAGAILLFLHADTLPPDDFLTLIRAALDDQRIVGGAFDLGFDTKRRSFKVTELYVSLRTRLTKVPFGDQAIFIRRDYFKELGGYKDIPIMEDADLMKRIRKRGDRIAIIPRKVMTSPRRYEREGLLYCTARNVLLQLLYAFGVAPENLARWYRFPPSEK